jgi:hypothetical protein
MGDLIRGVVGLAFICVPMVVTAATVVWAFKFLFGG